MFDYLIVGAGLFGSVCARELANARKRVLVIEKDTHAGGMCWTETVDGITVQRHGGHIFHCNDKRLWEYVNRFGEWKQYSHHVKANYRDTIYSFPINLMTLQQVFEDDWGRMADWVGSQPTDNENLEAWCLSQIGEALYERFIEGYTWKQWGRDPRELPASIIKRLPVRKNWNDEYFSDEFQGLPVKGYADVFANLLDGIKVEYGQDFLDKRIYWEQKARNVIYTGPLDKLFGYMVGRLDYRSLRFEHERLEVADYQGCPTMNYTARDVPFTRILEHKHWYPTNVGHTIITREFPAAYDGTNEPYYPINDAPNQKLHSLYQQYAASQPGLILGGRQATYRYIDMDQCVAGALSLVKKLLL